MGDKFAHISKDVEKMTAIFHGEAAGLLQMQIVSLEKEIELYKNKCHELESSQKHRSNCGDPLVVAIEMNTVNSESGEDQLMKDPVSEKEEETEENAEIDVEVPHFCTKDFLLQKRLFSGGWDRDTLNGNWS